MLNSQDQGDYEAGVRDAASGAPPVGATARYMYRVGYADRTAGGTRGNIKAGNVPDVTWAPFTVALTEEEALSYALGWDGAPIGSEESNFWARQGKQERLDGFPKRALAAGGLPGPFPDQTKIPTGTRRSEPVGPVAGAPPGGSSVPPAPPAPRIPPAPPPGGTPRPPYLTTYLYLELLFTVGGKRKPYDDVINRADLLAKVPILSQVLQALDPVRVRWLGDQPGEAQQGYQLSGPNGPIAWAVSDYIAQGFQPSPLAYGMPAWVGTKSKRGGVLMLGRAELADLSDALDLDLIESLTRVVRAFDPLVWDRYAGPVLLGDGRIAAPIVLPDGRLAAPWRRIDRF